MDNKALELQDEIFTNRLNEKHSNGAVSQHDHKAQHDDSSTVIKIEHVDSGLRYSINDVPPWYISVVLGFQHYLTMFGATLSMPLIITPAMCVGDDWVVKGEILGTLFFVSGLVTILQCTLGVRLPIIQGGTFSFIAPIFAILNLEKWQCPPYRPVNDTSNSTGFFPDIGTPEHRELWQSRMREIQGAIAVASVVQVIIGFTGAIGILLRFIGPLAVTPTIALIGLSLFKSAAGFCEKQWWIALMTMVLVLLFSQYLNKCKVPFCSYTKDIGWHRIGYPVFQVFPVILAVVLSWLICAILTVTNVLPKEPDKWGHLARTDTRLDVLHKASWFRFPYPGQWGMPTVSTAGVFGMLSGVLASMIESVGDYYACARLAGAPPPPVHATNRGIGVEGIGCIFAGLWGTGTGTTSYSENIGAIGITKVGSRRVILCGALCMIVFGLLGKFGALFVTIPDPIVGGVFMLMFGMVTAVGLSNLQFANMNTSRNLCIVGFSIFFGMCLPEWLKENPSAIATGVSVLEQIFRVMLTTHMFVGGFMGFLLDNTIPGTKEERGLSKWTKVADHNADQDISTTATCYDFPIGMRFIRKWLWTQYIPFCPTFSGGCCKKPVSISENTRRDSIVESHKNIKENLDLYERVNTKTRAVTDL